MDYYCDVCDKTIKIKSKNIHLKSLTHIQSEKSFPINHTIKNPYFPEISKNIQRLYH